MQKKTTYNFSKGLIKHQIEEEFYKIVGEQLSPKHKSSTIVTGPDYQRHIDNHRKYISTDPLRICEIDTDIFIDIYQGCKGQNNISVKNGSIENYGSFFIDCDLTCISDITVIENTLLKQVSTLKGCAIKNKAFIYTYSLRSNINTRSLTSLNNSVLGILGASVYKAISSSIISCKLKNENDNTFLNEVKLYGTKGRIKYYKSYVYNAGGGPMFTCLLIYK